MFNTEFNHITNNTDDYYPAPLRDEIDCLNNEIYTTVNNGVYQCGFATSQAAYDEAVVTLFESLNTLENRLAKQPYLCGATLTEADWRLFTTLIRFDPVYVGHFKCNLYRLTDFPALKRYLKHLYQYPGIASTVDFDHIKTHYYVSHAALNPTQIIPKGPDMTWLMTSDE